MRSGKPDTFRQFVSTLTIRSRVVLFIAIFCLFSTFGFLTDIISVGRHSAMHVAFDVGFSGVMAVIFAFVTSRTRRLQWPLGAAQLVAGLLVAATAPRIFADGPDVSGHGVHAGVVMGMVKTGLRMALRRGATLSDAFSDTNDVLMPLKGSQMFVTAAAIELDPNVLRFSVAGHLPILHHHAATGAVDELSVANPALGLVERQTYRVESTRCQRGDLLALITDGLVEVFDRGDRELGLDALKHTLAETAREPLADVLSALRETARRHGAQIDDQSALLLRAL